MRESLPSEHHDIGHVAECQRTGAEQPLAAAVRESDVDLHEVERPASRHAARRRVRGRVRDAKVAGEAVAMARRQHRQALPARRSMPCSTSAIVPSPPIAMTPSKAARCSGQGASRRPVPRSCTISGVDARRFAQQSRQRVGLVGPAGRRVGDREPRSLRAPVRRSRRTHQAPTSAAPLGQQREQYEFLEIAQDAHTYGRMEQPRLEAEHEQHADEDSEQ